MATSSALTQAQRVTRLYRNSLKHLLSWTIDRQAWRGEALGLRARFDEHKHEKDLNKAIKLIEDGEEEFHFYKHPDPYITPEAPEGSKWERNLPPPPWVLEMTTEEKQWYEEACKYGSR